MSWRRPGRDSAQALRQARAVEADLRSVLETLREHLDELETELSTQPRGLAKGGENA